MGQWGVMLLWGTMMFSVFMIVHHELFGNAWQVLLLAPLAAWPRSLVSGTEPPNLSVHLG